MDDSAKNNTAAKPRAVKPKTRPTRRRRDRRDEILKRAAEIFERQGFAHTSIEDIAREVGVKREAIYYYFKSRAEILLEIILPQSRGMLAGLREILDSEATAGEKLRAAIRNQLDKYGPHPGYLEMAVALREHHFHKEDQRFDDLRQVWKDYTAAWVELIRQGQISGAFHPEFDPKMIAFGILGMCNWLSRWYDPAKPTSLDEIIETYCAMIAHGLVKPETAKS